MSYSSDSSSTMAVAAQLIVTVRTRFFSSSSSSFHPSPTVSMQKGSPLNHNVAKVLNPRYNPQFQKWTIPLNHSLLPISIPADSESTHLTDKMSSEYGREMKSLKHLVSETAEVDPLESLNMIDAIQRLGIDHCFREEIEAILQTQYNTIPTNPPKSGLYELALRFRLLRQHGHFVPADVFESFMDKEGHLGKELREDIEGLMGLYEASQLCLPQEDKLEKIGNLSGHMLKCIGNLDDHWANHVISNTLANPFHKSLGKFLVKNYFGFEDYHLRATNKWIYVFQKMAKLDFNRVQSVHQQEISQLSRWWGQTGLSKELKFARDQPLKWYICSLAFVTDPMLSEERVDLAKSISFIYLVDDIYDLFGSLEQLRLFTKAIQRWNLADIDNLPHSMKICYIKLYETTNEISNKFFQKHGWNPINSLQKSWSRLCDAFLVEAEWFASGHLPSAKEYLRNGVVSCGVHVVLAHIFFLLGQGINSQTVQLLDTNPGIVSSTATILRLRDDLGSAKDENQEGYDGSYIEYYMKENPDISLDSTRQRVMHMISDAWKRLNKESLSPNQFPRTFIQASQNIARFVPLLYGYDENQNLPTLEKLMKSVLYQSVQI